MENINGKLLYGYGRRSPSSISCFEPRLIDWVSVPGYRYLSHREGKLSRCEARSFEATNYTQRTRVYRRNDLNTEECLKSDGKIWGMVEAPRCAEKA